MNKDFKLLAETYIELSKSFSPDSHLMRVYQAVKNNEWSFEDFKDFVSVIRNEAKITARE
jgi:hypothetical protein